MTMTTPEKQGCSEADRQEWVMIRARAIYDEADARYQHDLELIAKELAWKLACREWEEQ